MMKYMTLIFLFFAPLLLRASPSDDIRRKYADQMYSAFQLQSQGESTLAFFAFADAYRFAIKNGEAPEKLIPFDSLFKWYRMHGYNCGLMTKSSSCSDEYRSVYGYQKKPMYGSDFDPKQERIIRDFLFGVGQLISGVFCIAVNTPIGGRFGVPLVISGGKYMYDSISSMMQDSQEKNLRLQEIKLFEKQAAAAAQ